MNIEKIKEQHIIKAAAGLVLACDPDEVLEQYEILQKDQENGEKIPPNTVTPWFPYAAYTVDELLDAIDTYIFSLTDLVDNVLALYDLVKE